MKAESEDRKEISTGQPKPRWFIDFDWYQKSNRSFSALVQSHLCPACREQLKPDEREIPPAELLSTIRDCCSKTPVFITERLPILESVFRLFLANGNQPLELEEIGRQLSELRGGDTYCTSVDVLSRLLKNDQHYGLCQAPS